ncbi:MAG: hypothetical protein AAFU65_05245, partial [Pseudomonadota bacterium]
MSQNDDDLKTLWQSTPALDTSDLLKRVQRERRRMSWLFWFEVVATIFAIGMIGVYDYLDFFGDRRLAAWLGLLAALGLQVWMWHWRHGLWDAVSEAPMDLLTLQLKRARVGLRIAKYYAYGTPIGALLGVLASFYLVSDVPRLGLSLGVRITIIVALIAMIVGLTAFGVVMMR